MNDVVTESDLLLDLASLRLPSRRASAPTRGKLQRLRPGEKFLRGPIPWKWLSIAARLPGKALEVGLVIWLLAGIKNSNTIDLSRVPLNSLGVSRQAGYRGLKVLESAGLIAAERHAGRKTRVTLIC
jgi:hypothetical protein